jgi:PAS domain S-box-containing protein
LNAREGLAGRLQELRGLAKIPDARVHLDAVVPLLDAKMAHIAQVIELRRKQDTAGVIEMVAKGEGKRLMDLIRDEMNSFHQIEEAALEQNEAKFQSNLRRLLAIIVIASLLALLLALLFAGSIYRNTRHQLKSFQHLETQRMLETQQQANVTLQISEEKLAVTLNSIGDAVIATDREALITLLNPMAEKLTGWTQAEAKARPVSEVFHIINKDSRLPAIIPVMESLEHGTIVGLANHTVLIARGGHEYDIADSCAPIRDRENQVIGAVLVFRDVSSEYAIEQALREKAIELETAKAAAEKANLAKSDFLSSMSHELRSPLNAILGFAQLMESDSPLPTPTQKASIDQILHAGWFLLELINDILDLAVIESGRLSLSLEAVSLREVLIECQTMIEPQAQKRGISMTFPVFTEPCYVKADRTRLKQVLINLLSNAIKYNQTGGRVKVDCTQSLTGCMRISVKDTGVGLTQEMLAQLFQAFNRLGKEATGEEGTGIGLVVSKRLVELMQGQIGVESTVGTGSVFWIELVHDTTHHAEYTKAVNTVMTASPIPTGPDQRVLLYVEDNPANLKLVEQIIARHPDLRLLSAMNGQDGIALAIGQVPDVILMDINLPGISGIEAMKILRRDPITAHIPIIALSANAMPRDIEKGLEAGFYKYLTKPIKVNEFLETLNATLEFAAKSV